MHYDSSAALYAHIFKPLSIAASPCCLSLGRSMDAPCTHTGCRKALHDRYVRFGSCMMQLRDSVHCHRRLGTMLTISRAEVLL